MAVVQPFEPNLSGAYRNIQDALSQGADIASKNTGVMGSVAAAIAPIADIAKERGDAAFKAGLEDHLNQNKAHYMAQAEGRTLYKQEDVNNLMKTHYPDVDPEHYPQVGSEGFMGTPQEVQAMGEHGEYEKDAEIIASNVDKSQGKPQGDLVRFLSRDKNNISAVMQVASGGKIDWIKDDATGYHIAVNHYTKQPVPGMQPLELLGGALDDKGNLQVTDWTKLDPVTKKQVLPAITKAANDPEITKDISKLYQIQDVKKEILSDNPQAVINIKSETGQSVGQMAAGRMVGRIMEQEDVDPTIKAKAEQWFTKNLGTGALSDRNKKEGLDLLKDAEASIRKRVDANVSAKGQDIANASGNKIESGAAKKLASSKWNQFQNAYPADAVSPNTPKKISSQEEYDALSPGVSYIDDTGKIKVKGKK